MLLSALLSNCRLFTRRRGRFAPKRERFAEQLETRSMLAASAWTQIGGLGITNGQVEGMTAQNNPVIGSVHALLAHPTNPDVMYVGTVNGGVWKTTNATATSPTWATNTDQMPSLSIGALAFDLADTTNNTVWAGNGRYSSFAQFGGRQAGLLKTTDGGSTWTSMNGGGSLTGRQISGIAAQGSTIVVSASDTETGLINDVGIYRSTNGGVSFTKNTGGLPANGGVAFDLVRDPVNPNVLYAPIAYANIGGGTSGVYRSADFGATWTKVSSSAMDAHVAASQAVSNIEMAVGRSGEVYAGFVVQGRMVGLYRSPNGTSGWTLLDTPSTNEGGSTIDLNPRVGGKGPGDTDGDGLISAGEAFEIAGSQGGIHFSIVADPTNSNIVYVGGDRQPGNGDANAVFPNSLGAANYSGRLFRVNASLPSGSQATSLTHLIGVSTNTNSAPHADSRDMMFAANGVLFEVDDGGIYRRSNPQGLGDWTSAIGNLVNTEFHSLQYDHNLNAVTGGTQDVGTPRQTSTAGAFDSVSQGDGGVVAVDDSSSTSSIHYTSFQNFGGFRRTTYDLNGAATAVAFPARTLTGGGTAFRPQFYTPLELNAAQSNSLAIAGRDGIYVSADQGDTITFVGGPTFGTSMAFGAASNANLLYAGGGSGLFSRSTAGANLTQVTSYPGTGVTDIVIDPANANVVYVASSTGVYQTTNGGTSWTTITGSFVFNTIRSIEYAVGTFANAVLVGDLTGVYRSFTDDLSTWSEFAPNLPNVPVFDLDFDATDGVLTAGTQGRGAWTIPVSQVTNKNRDPIVTSATFTVAENSAVDTPVGTVVASDPDVGDVLMFSITAGNTGNTFKIDPATGAISVAATTPQLDFESFPTFTLTVTATDNGSPNLTGSGTITINLTNVNETATQVTLTPNSIQEGRPIGTRVGTLASDDVDAGDTFTYTLVSGQGDRDNTLFRIVGNELQTNQVLDFEGAPTLFVRVRVTDSGNNSAESLLAIVVGNVNEAPTDISLTPLTSPAFREDASTGTIMALLGATDSDIGDTFTFSLVTGTGSTDNAFFSVSANQLQLASPLDFETKPTLSIRLKVTDTGLAAFEKVFTINVSNVNEAPTSITLTNATVVEDVGGAVVGDLSAIDPDANDPITFSIVNVLDGAQFTLVGNQLRAGATGIDFEAGATRTVRILATDVGGLSRTQDFTITVLNTNEELTISSLSVAENSSLGTAVGTFSTVGATGPFTYTFVSGTGSTDNGLFTISGNQLLTNTALDFETKKSYSVRIKSTPTTGGPFERAFTISVTDQPEDPTAVLLTITGGVTENQAPPRQVGLLSALDPDAGSTFSFALVSGTGGDDNSLFTITNGNELTTAATFDREVKPIRSIRVRVTDNTNRTFDAVFGINILNVNEPPTSISFSTGGSVPENAPSLLVGNIVSNDPDIGDQITFRLAPRDQNSGLKDDSYLFEIRNGNQVFTRTTPLDFEAGTSRVIWVRATDANNLFVETSVTIAVVDTNDAPTFLSLTGGTVTENVTGQKQVGTLGTSDPDAVDNFTYALVAPPSGTNDNGLFSIVGDKLVTSSLFNFEARSSYTVRVESTDKGALKIARDFTITVVNVNEPPVNITLSTRTVTENKAAGTAIGTLGATDPEADTPIFSLVSGTGDSGNAKFRIDGNVLRTAAPLDFEAASSYSIRVQAADGAGAASTATFTITVVDDGAPVRFLRAFNRRGDYHFYTTNPAEFESVVRLAGFRDETTGQAGFNVLSDSLPGASPIYRLYNFQTQRHYYTTNAAERDILVNIVPPSHPAYGAVGWRYEKDEGMIFATQFPGTVAINRLYNNQTGVHLYTESITQRDSILRQFPGIWESHGIIGFGYPVAAAVAVASPVAAAAVSQPAPPPASAYTEAVFTAAATRVDTLVAIPTARPPSTAMSSGSSEATSGDQVAGPTATPLVVAASDVDDAFVSLSGAGLTCALD